MTVKIKTATIKNLGDVQRLNLMLFEKEFKEYDKTLNCKWTLSERGKEYFTKQITDKSCCAFVAYADNNIVGYLVGGVREKSRTARILPKFAELKNMYIINEYRNLGIGTKLFKSFLKWCKLKKVKRMQVVASAQNLKAIKFYRKNGFKDYDLVLETDI